MIAIDQCMFYVLFFVLTQAYCEYFIHRTAAASSQEYNESIE